MVRTLLLLLTVAAIASCGTARYSPGVPGPGDVEPSCDDEIVQRAIEDDAPMREEFEGIERLKENPVDPAHASVDALLSIPGFPEELARRIAAETGDGHSPGRWVERLTPPERSQLYRYRDYLVLGDPHPLRVNCRLTENGIGAGGDAKTEGYGSLSAFGCKALWRSKQSGTGGGTACYLSGSSLSGALRIHAGNILPDFALGLVLGGACQPYLLSSTYPFHAPRGFAGSTSFSAPAILGGAVEFWCRSVHGAFIVGRPRVYTSGHFEEGGDLLSGGRIGLRVKAGEIGVSAATGTSGPGSALCSIDGRGRSGALNAAFELAFKAGGEPGILGGLSYRFAQTRAAVFLHAIPGGMAGTFTMVNGRSLDAASSHGGISAVVERALSSRIRMRAAVDRYERRDGIDGRSRRVVRAECEREWKRASVRLSWWSTFNGRERVVPYPSAQTGTLERAASLGIVSDYHCMKGTSLRLALRGERKGRSLGLLVSPALTIRLSGRFKAQASLTFCRAIEGKPVIYFYESSLAGNYPWLAASGGKRRCALLIICNIYKLHISSKVALEARSSPDISLQAALSH